MYSKVQNDSYCISDATTEFFTLFQGYVSKFGEISGSHSDQYEDDYLLRCRIM
jgi:hypothetical protein